MFGNKSELSVRLKESEKLRTIKRLYRFLVVLILLSMLVRVYLSLPVIASGVDADAVEVSMHGLIGLIVMFLGEVLGVASSTLLVVKVVLQHLIGLLGLSLVHMIVYGHVRKKEKKRIKDELII